MEKKHEDVEIKYPDKTSDERVNEFETDSKLWNKNNDGDLTEENGDLTKIGNNGDLTEDKGENLKPKQERTSRSKVYIGASSLS